MMKTRRIIICAIPLCVIGSSGVMAQPALPAPTGAENTALTIVIATGGAIFLQAVFKEMTGVLHTAAAAFPKIMEERQRERMAKTDALQNVVEQNEKLFEELRRRDEQLNGFTKTLLDQGNVLLESQRLNNELRALSIQEREQFRTEMKIMIDEAKVKDAAMEALAKENASLKEENAKLSAQVEALREELVRLKATFAAPSVTAEADQKPDAP